METTNELLWIDEKAIKNENSYVMKAQDELNEFIEESETFIGKIGPEDMIKLKDEGFSYLESKVQKLFEHPKAKRDFNLQALGIEPVEFDGMRKYNSAPWTPYEFEIINGKFQASENQTAFQKHYHYADTEQKKQMLRVAQQIVDCVNDAKTLGMDRSENFNMVTIAFNNLVVLDGDPRGGSGTSLKVNKMGIGQFQPSRRKSYLIR